MRSFFVMFLVGTVLGAALMFVLVRTGRLGPSGGVDPDELIFDATVQAEPGSPQERRIEYAKRVEKMLRKDDAQARVRADGLVLKIRASGCNQAFVVKLVEKPADKQGVEELGFARLRCSHGRTKAWLDL